MPRPVSPTAAVPSRPVPAACWSRAPSPVPSPSALLRWLRRCALPRATRHPTRFGRRYTSAPRSTGSTILMTRRYAVRLPVHPPPMPWNCVSTGCASSAWETTPKMWCWPATADRPRVPTATSRCSISSASISRPKTSPSATTAT